MGLRANVTRRRITTPTDTHEWREKPPAKRHKHSIDFSMERYEWLLFPAIKRCGRGADVVSVCLPQIAPLKPPSSDRQSPPESLGAGCALSRKDPRKPGDLQKPPEDLT